MKAVAPRPSHYAGNRRVSGWKVSLAGHAVLLLVLVTAGLFKGCATEKPPEELIYVEFTVALPPAEAPAEAEPAPDEPEAEPEPEPEPEPIPEPEPEPPKPPPEPPKKPDPPPKPPEPKKPDPPPKKPDPPKKKDVSSIRQTNRVMRAASGPQLTDEQIRALLNQGATVGPVTSIPADASGREMGKWFNDVTRIMKAGWTKPSGALPGTECVVEVEVEANGHIGRARIIGSSGNAAMDRSVQAVLDRPPNLPKPPGGARKFTITYTLE